MSYTAFQALVRRDLRLFFMDRRAVTMSFIAPIAIASFFGYIFGGVTQNGPPSKIGVAVVNQDDTEISRKVVTALTADAALDVKSQTLKEARELVREDNGGGGDSTRLRGTRRQVVFSQRRQAGDSVALRPFACHRIASRARRPDAARNGSG
jgi:hypothetical protein